MGDLKIFVIAGEASGDLLASAIIKNIRLKYGDNIEIKGVAGELLINQGVKSIFPQNDISVMGFVEVIPAIPRVLNRIKLTVTEILSFKPDIIITIDSPDFNFRVIKKLKKIGINNSKIIHIVAPTVWAYRKKRAEKIAKLYDLLLVLLPFEPPYFTKYGLNTKFIGHPIIYKDYSLPTKDVIEKYNIKGDSSIITITLGSRNKEVKTLSPIYKEALKKIYETEKDITVIIPTFDKYLDFFGEWIQDIPFKTVIVTDETDKFEFFRISKFVIAKSGTNTIEIAKQNTAFMACYKVNLLTYLLLKIMVKTKHVNLLNIFAQKEVIPEYIQYKCSADNIARKSIDYLNDKNLAVSQAKEQGKYLTQFSNQKDISPSEMAAEEILKLVK